jgi:peptide/nickel transport system substrate-binding protein
MNKPNNRRRFLLTSGAAAGLLAASGLPLAAKALKGGRLRAGLSGAHSSDSWDARTHADTFMIVAGHGAVFDCLTEVKADGTLAGELAESWETSADARVWTFNLRPGVRFHNGKRFGAEDVIASLQLHLEEGTRSPARPIVEAITEMRATDPLQVQFTLAHGNADFPYLMSDYHLVIYPADGIEEAMAHGIGTGLYEVQSFRPGVRLTATRVKDHYKGEAAGHFDVIEFIAMNDAGMRMKAMASGVVDTVNRVDLRAKGPLEETRRIRLQDIAGNQHYSFAMDVKRAPFDSVHLRRALKHGIDRQEMVDMVLAGHGQIGNDTPIGPANPYYAHALEQTAYDPDKALFHLKQAGMGRLSINLSASGAAFEGAVDAARLFRETARGGIDINVVSEAADGYWTDVWQEKPFCACASAGRATEDWVFTQGYSSGAPWNVTGWDEVENARFQALLLTARAELDSQKRREMYAEMQMILRDDGGMIVPMFANHVQAVSSRIATPDVIGNLWQMDNARMAERWWRA